MDELRGAGLEDQEGCFAEPPLALAASGQKGQWGRASERAPGRWLELHGVQVSGCVSQVSQSQKKNKCRLESLESETVQAGHCSPASGLLPSPRPSPRS